MIDRRCGLRGSAARSIPFGDRRRYSGRKKKTNMRRKTQLHSARRKSHTFAKSNISGDSREKVYDLQKTLCLITSRSCFGRVRARAVLTLSSEGDRKCRDGAQKVPSRVRQVPIFVLISASVLSGQEREVEPI